MAHALRHLEPREDRHEDKQVVDAEHFLQRVAGEEQAGDFRAVIHIQEPSKAEGQHNPENGPE